MTLAVSTSHLAATYKRHPLEFVRGEGVYLFDADGKKYLDLLGGIAVNALGHAHPAVLNAMQAAMQGPIHVSNLYRNGPSERLATRLCELSFADSVFLCNSGAEAIEGAIKMARKWKPGGGKVVAFQGAFHGRTLGSLSLTWNAKYREPFEPLMPGVEFAEFNRIDAITPGTAAVVVEPIQGEGGVVPATAEFLQALRQQCDAVGAALIFDEIQAGLGRTGSMWAHSHSGVTPDIMTLAKPLGGGLPIGAILMTGQVANALSFGDHGTTFGGGPFVSTVALAVLDTIAGLLDHVTGVGKVLEAGLRGLHSDSIVAVRGRGLMWGIQLAEAVPVDTIVAAGHQAGVLLGTSAGNTIRLLPALILDEAQATTAVSMLGSLLP